MAISAMGKTTWWNKVRVERNIRIRDLLELFPEYQTFSTIGAWFTGQFVPKDKHIRVLCDFFDVDFDEGKRHFIEDHERWESTKRKGKRAVTGTAEGVMKELVTGTGDAKSVIKTKTEEPKKDIFEAVYGKLPYDLFRTFCDLVAHSDKNALELVYGKVSYEDFMLIQEVIKG